MAVGAIFCRADAARGVREMRIKRLPTVTFSGKSLLLRVNPLAIGILRADHDRARRADDRHAVFLHRPVNPEHEDVVAHDLWIVGREIAIGYTFKLILRDAMVRFHLQMESEAARCTGGVE